MLFRRKMNYDSEDTYTYEVMSIEQNDVRDGVLGIPAAHCGKAVTSIGPNAGKGIDARLLVLRSGIANISENAFENSSITDIRIPASVKEIGAYAFSGCKNLKQVSALDDANKFLVLGKKAFYGCQKLKEFGLTPRRVGISAFENCVSLDFEAIENIEEIGARGFKSSGITRVSAAGEKSKLRYIGHEAFAECKSLRYAVLEGKAEVKDEAFARCTNMNSVIMQDGITLDEMVFMGCTRLVECKWPKTLSAVPYGTFSDCHKLEKVDGCEFISKVEDYGFYGTNITDLGKFTSLNLAKTKENSFARCERLIAYN